MFAFRIKVIPHLIPHLIPLPFEGLILLPD